MTFKLCLGKGQTLLETLGGGEGRNFWDPGSQDIIICNSVIMLIHVVTLLLNTLPSHRMMVSLQEMLPHLKLDGVAPLLADPGNSTPLLN